MTESHTTAQADLELTAILSQLSAGTTGTASMVFPQRLFRQSLSPDVLFLRPKFWRCPGKAGREMMGPSQSRVTPVL